MSKSIIAEGNTTNHAIENGLKQLNVTKDMVEIKVLEEEKRSFFSILAPRVVKVELTLKEEPKKEGSVTKKVEELSTEEQDIAFSNVDTFLKEFLKKLGENIKYKINKTKEGLDVYITNEDLGYLIGYRGETLYAMQNIISAVASKGLNHKVRVIIDIEG